MNATFAWIIDSISILIGFSGIPSNILDGFLNNAFLAFQLIEHYEPRHAVAPTTPASKCSTRRASAPYNIETLFGFINALWDSRGYTSATAVFRNGEVYTLGRDVFRGGLMSLLYHNRTSFTPTTSKTSCSTFPKTPATSWCSWATAKPRKHRWPNTSGSSLVCLSPSTC
jgi:hypothetical protein